MATPPARKPEANGAVQRSPAQPGPNGGGKDVAVAKPKQKTIRDWLIESRGQIEAALPRQMNPDRLIRIVLTEVRRSDKLQQCTAISLVKSVIQSAQVGLEPDSMRGLAYLIPYRNKGVYECQLQVGYKGMIELAFRSGKIKSISSQVVYEHDRFTLEYGLEEKLVHVPKLDGNRGKPLGAYAVAHMKGTDGGYAFDFMTEGAIMDVRKRSRSANDGPWVTDTDEMRKKTVIRRLAKYLPLSPEFQEMAAKDELADRGLLPTDDPAIDVTPGIVAEATAQRTASLREKYAAQQDGNDVAQRESILSEVRLLITRVDQDAWVGAGEEAVKQHTGRSQIEDLTTDELIDLSVHLSAGLAGGDSAPA